MIHEIVPDRVVHAGINGELDLRAHTVRARHEQRGSHPFGHAEHAAESAERAARSRRERRLDECLDAILRVVGRLDVDAGRAIVERRGHPTSFLLERDEPAELVDARVEIGLGDLEEPVDRKALHGERAHGASRAHDGAAHVPLAQIAVLRQVADEAAGEGIARAGGIEHRFSSG